MLLTAAQRLRALAVAAGLMLAAAPAMAQNYPTSPVHLIVAYSAGGTGDVVARIVAPKFRWRSASPSSSKTAPARAAPSARIASPPLPPMG